MDFLDIVSTTFQSVWSRITGRRLLQSIICVEEQISRWFAIYRGKQHWLPYEYVAINGYRRTRNRNSLHMARFVCRELSKLVWSEMPGIETKENDPLMPWLDGQNFWNRIQKFTEYGSAGGGFCMKLRAPEKGGLIVDFVPADMFIPVSWDNTGIYEADFISRRVDDKKVIITIESHRRISPTQYEIRYVEGEEDGLYLKDKKGLPSVTINTTVPLFIYVPNPDVNNIDIDSPLGVSIFANAEDTLYSLDVAFDALSQELILGKRRIIVPASALRTVLDPKSGKEVRYFDSTDEAYVAFNMKDAESQKIVDNTVELRVEQIVAAIKALLDILAIQTGFSPGTFSFDGDTVKTATEVISENSASFRTKQSYENQLTHGLQKLFAAVREIGDKYGLGGVGEVSISWNDSIIEDSAAKAKRWTDRYINKTCTLEDFLMNVDGLTYEQAEEKAEEIREKSKNVDVDPFLNAGE